MTDFICFQSIVNYRVPIVSGKLGTPQVTNKFTREVKGSHKKKVKPLKTVKLGEVEEVLM